MLLFSTFITEIFKIYISNNGIDSAIFYYFQTGKIKDLYILNKSFLIYFSLIEIAVSFTVHGMLFSMISVILDIGLNPTLKKIFHDSFLLLTKRFWDFLGASITVLLFFFIGSFFNLIGFIISTACVLVLFPVIFIKKLSLFSSIKENFRLLFIDIFYVIKVSSLITLFNLLKISFNFLLIFLSHSSNSFQFGLYHVLFIFFNTGLSLFIISSSFVVFQQLNSKK